MATTTLTYLTIQSHLQHRSKPTTEMQYSSFYISIPISKVTLTTFVQHNLCLNLSLSWTHSKSNTLNPLKEFKISAWLFTEIKVPLTPTTGVKYHFVVENLLGSFQTFRPKQAGRHIDVAVYLPSISINKVTMTLNVYGASMATSLLIIPGHQPVRRQAESFTARF